MVAPAVVYHPGRTDLVGIDAVLDRLALVVGRIAARAVAARRRGREVERPDHAVAEPRAAPALVVTAHPFGAIRYRGEVPGVLFTRDGGVVGIEARQRSGVHAREGHLGEPEPVAGLVPGDAVDAVLVAGQIEDDDLPALSDRSRRSDCGCGDRGHCYRPRVSRHGPSNPRWHLRHNPTRSCCPAEIDRKAGTGRRGQNAAFTALASGSK